MVRRAGARKITPLTNSYRRRCRSTGATLSLSAQKGLDQLFRALRTTGLIDLIRWLYLPAFNATTTLAETVGNAARFALIGANWTPQGTLSGLAYQPDLGLRSLENVTPRGWGITPFIPANQGSNSLHFYLAFQTQIEDTDGWGYIDNGRYSMHPRWVNTVTYSDAYVQGAVIVATNFSSLLLNVNADGKPQLYANGVSQGIGVANGTPPNGNMAMFSYSNLLLTDPLTYSKRRLLCYSLGLGMIPTQVALYNRLLDRTQKFIHPDRTSLALSAL